MERLTLENGLRLVILPTALSEIVAVRIFWRGGASLETAQTQGLAHLIGVVLAKGTPDLNSQQIAGQIEQVGASLGIEVQDDYTVLSLSCLRPDFAHLLALVAQVIQHPTFPESEVALERRNTLLGIRSQQERPFTLAYNQLRQDLYGPDHPYGFLDLGTEETVTGLTLKQLENYHQGCCQPDRLVVCVASALDPGLIVDTVDQCFGSWRGTQPFALPDLVCAARPVTHTHIPQATEQILILLGYPVVGIHHPDYPVLKLITTYLGSGLSSRLFVELREKQGLAYEVSAFYPTLYGDGHFATYIGTAPHNLPVAEAGLRQEVKRLADTLLDPEEFHTAQTKILGQYALSKQSSAQIARTAGLYEIFDLGADYDHSYVKQLKKITRDQLQAVAQRYFGEPTVTLVGPTP